MYTHGQLTWYWNMMNAFTLLFVSLDQLYMWIFTERMLPALVLPLVLHFIPILERLMQDCRLIFQHLERRTPVGKIH